MKCSVGALLYTPALNTKIAEHIIDGEFGELYSLALCLEDTVADDAVEMAEKQLVESIKKIYETSKEKEFYIPKIFIRVRNSGQLQKIHILLQDYMEIITGYIFPKYTVENGKKYNELIRKFNDESDKKIFMMPILESKDIVDYSKRHNILIEIKELLDTMEEYVLNIRIGGNDFSNEFAVRRHYSETIYDILPISQLIGEIIALFSRDYVVSGPVWEYFSSDNQEWKQGLIRELKYDRLNGIIGKTVIHPKQIPVVNDSLKVSNKDYEDAKEILHWDKNGLQVGKSFAGERMNEVKTHLKWAVKIVTLADVYGIS
jgi:citrate lyase beta subunit